MRGAYFAIGTWVVAEVCRLVLAQVKQLGGGTGTSLPPDIASSIVGLDLVRNFFAVRGPAARDMMVYWLALLLALGTFALVYRLLRSRHGLALSALGDSETAAESTGVDVFRTKLLIYVLTAVATGMVGARAVRAQQKSMPVIGFFAASSATPGVTEAWAPHDLSFTIGRDRLTCSRANPAIEA